MITHFIEKLTNICEKESVIHHIQNYFSYFGERISYPRILEEVLPCPD